MNKLAGLVLNWNMERFILPHIEMLLSGVDHVLMLQCDKPFSGYRDEHKYSEIPDRSEELVRKHFPQVQIEHYEVIEDSPSVCFPTAFNYGFNFLRDYDLVVKLDVDMFFIDKDWKEFISILRETKKKNICLDWAKNSVNYHYKDNYDHGCMNQVETDPLAVDPHYYLSYLLNYPFEREILQTNIVLHHFRSWKNEESTRRAVEVAEQWMRDNGNPGWISAPEEIKQKLMKQYD